MDRLVDLQAVQKQSGGHHLRNRGAVRDHAARTHDLRKITARNNGGRLIVDAALEAGRAPVDELDRALRLDRRLRESRSCPISAVNDTLLAVRRLAPQNSAAAQTDARLLRC